VAGLLDLSAAVQDLARIAPDTPAVDQTDALNADFHGTK
jgi:hypothetical protein